jgi:hypothetical protein
MELFWLSDRQCHLTLIEGLCPFQDVRYRTSLGRRGVSNRSTPGGGDVPRRFRPHEASLQRQWLLLPMSWTANLVRLGDLLEAATETAGRICVSYVAHGAFVILRQEGSGQHQRRLRAA